MWERKLKLQEKETYVGSALGSLVLGDRYLLLLGAERHSLSHARLSPGSRKISWEV